MKAKGTKLTNPLEVHKLLKRLKNAYITKTWDNFDSAIAIDLLEQLASSYDIMFDRYFTLINVDTSEIEKIKDLYFIDETEVQVVFIDNEKH